MPAGSIDIAQDLIAAIRSAGEFSTVGLGGPVDGAALPSAWVRVDGVESFPADDQAGGTWQRVRLSVRVLTRADVASRAQARLAELIGTVTDAILTDPHRGGRCEDLPIGLATEIGTAQPDRLLTGADVAAELTVRCHFPATT